MLRILTKQDVDEFSSCGAGAVAIDGEVERGLDDAVAGVAGRQVELGVRLLAAANRAKRALDAVSTVIWLLVKKAKVCAQIF